VRKLCAALAAALACVAYPHAQVPLGVETFDAAWTVIRDTHFDPAMNGVDWNSVKTELRPKAVAARTDGELRAVVRDMLSRLGQSHFALIPAGADVSTAGKSDLSGHVGFDTRLVGRDIVVTRVAAGSSAATAGVRTGWILEAVDSQPIQQILAPVPASMPTRLFQVEAFRAIEVRLRGPSGSRVQLTFRDAADRTVPIALERRPEIGEPARVGNLPTMYVRVESERQRTPTGGTVGVIRFNVWMAAVDASFQKAMDQHRQADGIVVDLRGNPGGLAVMLRGLSGHFLTEPTALGVMKTRDSELRFTANPRLVDGSGQRVTPFAGPLAILVDAMTGSASECFAGGMQSLGRARVFGQSTMGQALPAVFHRLPNEDVLIHAYGDFVTANGTRLEGRGVIPDEQVPLSREDLLGGRDATMERALQWIDGARSKSQ
jgi:carboxyl-terminal processing protease